MGSEMVYPYVVIRWMATVYCRRPFVYLDETASDSEAAFRSDRPNFPIKYGGSLFDENGKLVREAREALIAQVMIAVKASRFRMCIVEGPGQAIYIEPDGSVIFNRTAPSGGIQIDQLDVVKRK